MGYNSVQKQVLEALLDQYERSKTYQGENKVIQSFQIPPEKVFPDYASDYADMDQIRDFEAWMRELEQDGLITIKYGSGEIRRAGICIMRSCREGISFHYSRTRSCCIRGIWG